MYSFIKAKVHEKKEFCIYMQNIYGVYGVSNSLLVNRLLLIYLPYFHYFVKLIKIITMEIV